MYLEYYIRINQLNVCKNRDIKYHVKKRNNIMPSNFSKLAGFDIDFYFSLKEMYLSK